MAFSQEYNLTCKHTVRFDSNGKLKILMLSDIQEVPDHDGRSLAAMHAILDRVQPDVVVLGGDNCDHTAIGSLEELRAYLDIFTAPMEERGILWMHIFGNHDHDLPMPDADIAALYEQYPHCISKHSQGIYGTGNYVIPVYHADGDGVVFALWALDSNNLMYTAGMMPDGKLWDMRRPINSYGWDVVHFDQLMWYWNSSVALEAHAGAAVPGILFMHIAPWEAQIVVDNPALCGTTGSTAELMGLGALNAGLFSAVLQRGDVRCIASGHSHNDDFAGELCGVTLCLDACAGYHPYGTDTLRGGRVFEIDAASPRDIRTYMVHYADL